MAAHRLVLIDSAIASPEILTAGVLPDTSVEIIDRDRDGIEQMTEALQRYPGTASLHLVSHGAPGTIYLGNTELSLETLDRYASRLMGWAEWLTPNADLLIYGCEVAKDERGRSFIARLSELTGVSIAASATKTGAAALDGDWNLEAMSGKSAAALAFRSEAMLAYGSVLAAAGDLDSTFGTGGKVTTDFDNGSEYSLASTILQSDGKLVLTGITYDPNASNRRDFALSRYNNDGSLDTGFGIGGKVTTDFSNDSDDFLVNALQQRDGKFVLAGYTYNPGGSDRRDFAISRYNFDGTLDTSFGIAGKVETDFLNNSDDYLASAIQQQDGKLVLAGVANYSVTGSNRSDFALSRYNSDGSLDTGFGVGGKVLTNFSPFDYSVVNVMQQGDGKLVLTGTTNFLNTSNRTDFAMSRYNANGSLDTTFGNGGKVTTDFSGGSVDFLIGAVQLSDGKFILAGNTNDYNSSNRRDFALSRYNTDGKLDTGFGINGKVTTDFNNSSDDSLVSVIRQSDGKVVLVGNTADPNSSNSSDFAMSRYNNDGSLDTSFGINGKVTTDFDNGSYDWLVSATQQSDGKFVLAGITRDPNSLSSYFAMSRYNNDGSLDTSFGTNGKVTTDFDNGSVNSLANMTQQSDGKIILTGASNNDFALARYLSTASTVTANSTVAANSTVTANNDFNGDGTTDVVTRNQATGETAIALMNDTAVTQFVFSTLLPDPNWTIDGAGDFDKDGKPDVVLRNRVTGQNAVAIMDGTNLNQFIFPEILPDPNWSIGGVGDFNKDGNLDLLYRNRATGENAFALMKGTTLMQTVAAQPVPDLNWEIGGVGDFNRDGNDDVLFRNKATGENAFALMNGTEVAQIVSTAILPDLSWSIGSVGDYNRDGNVDILYRNQRTGENSYALMNGTNPSQIVSTIAVTDTNWQIGA